MKTAKPLLVVLLVVGLVVVTILLVRCRWTAPGVEQGRAHPQTGAPRTATTPKPMPPLSIPQEKSKPGGSQQPALTRNEAILEQIEKLKVSDTIRVIVGLAGDAKDFNARRNAMRTLNRNLTPDDSKALGLYLDSLAAEEKNLAPGMFNGIKNDLLDVLLRQNQVADGLGTKMAGMFRDERQDDVWRDYCIQYFAAYYDSKWAVGNSDTNVPERADIQNAYWEATEARGKTFAGTALLAMERMSRQRPEFDRTKVGDKASAIAMDETAAEANRITCMRLCGTLGRTEVLPAARTLAQTGSTGPLRMAATATIGDLGEKSDIELLESFAAGSDKRTKPIAESALKRLQKRLDADHAAAK